MRKKMLVPLIVTGVLGATALGAASSRVLAATTAGDGLGFPASTQAAPTPACPFAGDGGALDVEAMRAHMDGMHGEGSFDRMPGTMGGTMGHGSGTVMGAGMMR